jgi:hypothetical protein
MDKELIIREFNRIKNLGYVKSRRSNNTGIGKTFEDYLGVTENNDKLPDFAGFEVKSQRALTSSYLTLFTKSPTGPVGANTYLRDTYGEFYEEYPTLKRLHTSIFSERFNTYKGTYGFKIENSGQDKTIRIIVKNIETDKIIDNRVYWTYDDIRDCIEKKLNNLFYVNADTKIVENIEHFHFTQAKIYIKPRFEKLLELIDQGKIMVDIRIGSYKSGNNKGKTHDHGTGFRIKPIDLSILYSDVINI